MAEVVVFRKNWAIKEFVKTHDSSLDHGLKVAYGVENNSLAQSLSRVKGINIFVVNRRLIVKFDYFDVESEYKTFNHTHAVDIEPYADDQDTDREITEELTKFLKTLSKFGFDIHGL